jgi:hypothetical protein
MLYRIQRDQELNIKANAIGMVEVDESGKELP